MTIDNLTIGEARQIAAMFGGQQSGTFTPHIGKKCIVRTYASGVFFGTVTKQDGRMVEIADCRRMWSWKAAEGISLSAVVLNGVDAPNCIFPAAVPTQTVLDALELIPASDRAILTIESTPVAEAR